MSFFTAPVFAEKMMKYFEKGALSVDFLSSKNNEKIKSAAAVRSSSKTRRESGLFFLEGARLCRDAAESGTKIMQAFFSSAALEKYSGHCEKIIAASKESYTVSDEVAEKLSDTQNSQGIFCVCKVKNSPNRLQSIDPEGKYLLLENIQDPSNLGAVSRTAEALGISGLIVCGGCDIYNPKALRASMGSALRLNIIVSDSAEEVIREANSKGMLTLASTPSRESENITALKIDGGAVCAVGNEGNGVSEKTMNACRKKVTIPMEGRAESLNAATAAAILIWEMVRK